MLDKLPPEHVFTMPTTVHSEWITHAVISSLNWFYPGRIQPMFIVRFIGRLNCTLYIETEGHDPSALSCPGYLIAPKSARPSLDSQPQVPSPSRDTGQHPHFRQPPDKLFAETRYLCMPCIAHAYHSSPQTYPL